MKSVIAMVALFLLTLCTITAASLLFLPGHVSAEYWLRPTIIEKEAIAAGKPSPRIIILGGSSALFAFDAGQIERETGVSTVNFGLHAGFRLERLLQEADRVTKKGDLLVLALEPNFYECGTLDWSPWSVRNGIAWDRDRFNDHSLFERLNAVLTGGSAGLLFDQWIGDASVAITDHQSPARAEALEPAAEVLTRWRSGKERVPTFEYSQFNIDQDGDMTNIDGAMAGTSGLTGAEDKTICPAVSDILTRFVASQKARGVTTVFAHHPYMIAGTPDPHWPEAEASFRAAIEKLGSTLIDQRQELFYPPADMFNMNMHLNSIGRKRRSELLVTDLRLQGLITAASPGSAATTQTPTRVQ